MNSNYLIISGTNRIGSKSLQVSNLYSQLLFENNIENNILSLENLPLETFDINNKSEILKQIEDKYLIPATKIIFVVPEYNGSFPGSLKLLMDCCDPKNVFWNKKASLVGIADGRNGNLRGLDHLTGVLNYLKINVLHYKVNIPFIGKTLGNDQNTIEPQIQQLLNKQIEEFIKF